MPYDENGNYITDEYSQIDYSPAANDPYRLIQTSQGDMTVEQALNWLRQRYAQMGLDDSYLPSDVYGIQVAIDQVGGTTPLRPTGYTPNAAPTGSAPMTASWQNDLYQITDPASRQVAQQLGWNPDALTWAQKEEVYRRAVGSAPAAAPAGSPTYQNTYVAPASAASAVTTSTGDKGFNAAAANAAAALAQQVAYQKYLDEKLRQLEIPQMQAMSELERDKLAFQKAQQAYLEAYNQARLDFERPSFEQELALKRDQFGLSQQQLEEERRQFDAAQAQQAEQFRLQYGLQQQQAEMQGALGLMNIAAQLRGPADYFQYLQTLSGTPQGLKDLVGAAAGRYQVPGFGAGAPGAQSQPVSLGGFMAQIAGQAGGTPQSYGLAQTGLGETREQIAANLPDPRNWSAENIARMSPTQRSLLSGLYEYAQGKRPEDVEWEFRQSLPKVGGPAGGTFRF